MKKYLWNIVWLFLCCSSGLPITPFGDFGHLDISKNRAVFPLDVDFSPLFTAENRQPERVLYVKAFGKIYVTAPGFQNVYGIVPDNKKQMKYKPLKLKRDEILPFSKVAFDWAEEGRLLINWEDAKGAHANVVEPKGKIRRL